MLRHVKTSSTKLKILCSLLFVIVLSSAIAAIAKVFSYNSTAKLVATSQSAPTSPTGKRRIEGELLVVRPSGFEPKEIKRPSGQPFLLAVDNQSGLPVLSLELNSSAGPAMPNATVPREKRVWSEVLHLPPGVYTLRESNHSDWVCSIIVE